MTPPLTPEELAEIEMQWTYVPSITRLVKDLKQARKDLALEKSLLAETERNCDAAEEKLDRVREEVAHDCDDDVRQRVLAILNETKT